MQSTKGRRRPARPQLTTMIVGTISAAFSIIVLAAIGLAASARAAARPTFLVGEFRGAIRTGPLADLSLSGLLALHVDRAGGAISGVLVDGDGAGRRHVLAKVAGHAGAHQATLTFRLPSGRVITGTSSRALAQGAILRGSLITEGGRGDWIEVPPGTITDPAPVVCVEGVAVCYIKGHPPLVIPPPGSRKTPAPPGGPSGDETFCMELEAGLNIKDVEIQEQLEDLGCPLPGTSGP